MEAARNGTGVIDLSQLGLGNAADIVDQMEEREKQIQEYEVPWEERLQQ